MALKLLWNGLPPPSPPPIFRSTPPLYLTHPLSLIIKFFQTPHYSIFWNLHTPICNWGVGQTMRWAFWGRNVNPLFCDQFYEKSHIPALTLSPINKGVAAVWELPLWDFYLDGSISGERRLLGEPWGAVNCARYSRVKNVYVMLCAIWYHLQNLKKWEKHPWRKVTFRKGGGLSCTNGTKSLKASQSLLYRYLVSSERRCSSIFRSSFLSANCTFRLAVMRSLFTTKDCRCTFLSVTACSVWARWDSIVVILLPPICTSLNSCCWPSIRSIYQGKVRIFSSTQNFFRKIGL